MESFNNKTNAVQIHCSVSEKIAFHGGKSGSVRTETRTYQCYLDDTTDGPLTPINLGNLSPVGPIKKTTTWEIPVPGSEPIEASHDSYSSYECWICTNHEMNREYGVPGSTRYTETWQYRHKFQPDEDEE